ncbi:nuclear transport factor 2 family protein [Planktothrix mougeotii LEGE 06226]|uniref:Nuclear transport factor 2 family protein n=1 Tax=Planktothrix mougeotii LEGE 06226 TaxID=1828728 RepID=A0ABR9UCZ3_9CYAN|nr:nuclear transport factor 2 family protein [Planktothrix mougeotii LEGE 06226]
MQTRPILPTPLFSVVLGLVIWGTGTAISQPVNAETPETAPANVTNLLTQIDDAANRQDVEAVMGFYSSNFTNSDGLNHQTLKQVLKDFWNKYSRLNYRTQLQSWQQNGNALTTTTVTEITGTKTINNREFSLTSTITSQQQIEGGKIVQQEILAEKNKLTLGNQPPTVVFNVPQEVKIGQEYTVDAIVQEPLNEEILIGTAITEPVTAKAYTQEGLLQLEFLPSGGIFKVGQAPNTSGDNWVSAILMRQGGVTLVTQRLRVVK